MSGRLKTHLVRKVKFTVANQSHGGGSERRNGREVFYISDNHKQGCGAYVLKDTTINRHASSVDEDGFSFITYEDLVTCIKEKTGNSSELFEERNDEDRGVHEQEAARFTARIFYVQQSKISIMIEKGRADRNKTPAERQYFELVCFYS